MNGGRPLRELRSTPSALLAVTALVLAGCGLIDPAGETITTTTPTTTTTVAASTTTVPPQLPDSAEAEPVPEEALDAEGIGDLGVGYLEEEARSTGVVDEILPRCDGRGRNMPLHMENVTGFAVLEGDHVDAIIVHEGAVFEGGRVGQQTTEFVELSKVRYDWSVDHSYEESRGFWLGTLTERETGMPIQVEIDPTTDSVMSVAVPYLPVC